MVFLPVFATVLHIKPSELLPSWTKCWNHPIIVWPPVCPLLGLLLPAINHSCQDTLCLLSDGRSFVRCKKFKLHRLRKLIGILPFRVPLMSWRLGRFRLTTCGCRSGNASGNRLPLSHQPTHHSRPLGSERPKGAQPTTVLLCAMPAWGGGADEQHLQKSR